MYSRVVSLQPPPTPFKKHELVYGISTQIFHSYFLYYNDSAIILLFYVIVLSGRWCDKRIEMKWQGSNPYHISPQNSFRQARGVVLYYLFCYLLMLSNLFCIILSSRNIIFCTLWRKVGTESSWITTFRFNDDSGHLKFITLFIPANDTSFVLTKSDNFGCHAENALITIIKDSILFVRVFQS